MKTLVVLFSLLLSANVFASDLCRAKALAAAEDDYGNYPDGTSVRTLVAGERYWVSVGRGNAEDGEHYYEVTFHNGCTSQPSVREVAN